MNAVTVDQREQGWDSYEDGPNEESLPRRPRRQFFNRRSAALAALLTCAAGFYAGVRVEKGQLASTPSLTLPTATGAGGAGAAGGRAASGAAGASRTAGAAGGFAGAGRLGAAGGALAGGNVSLGTVSSVNGKTLFLTEVSGNTVKVKLASTTKISKSLSVSRSSVRPGDTVIVQGVPNATGTVVAASVTDSGAGRGSAAGSSSSSGASSGSSGSGSAVGSLFSGGG
jgi:Domain of unknown function (DUF5666)